MTVDYIVASLSRAAGEDVGTYAITAAGEAVQGNYKVTYVPAKLTIKTADAVIVTITGNSGSYKYDGTAKDISGYTVTTSNPLYTAADFTFSGNSDLKGTNAGTYTTNMLASDFANANANFKDVEFVVSNGTLEITKRAVTLTSAGDEKKFDGTALTNSEVTISGDGFVEGEGVTFTVTGRQTNPGESNNTFTYALTKGTKAGNYSISQVYGKLKVTDDEEDEEVIRHTLTINYQYEDGTKAANTFTRQYMEGRAYSVTSKKIAGYSADKRVVRGTMGTEDITVTVTYSKNTYTLTVSFVSIIDGTQVATPATLELSEGEDYTIYVPAVEGYTAPIAKVTGTMPDHDRSVKVFLTPEGTEFAGGALRSIEIEDFGTPLGLVDTVLGGDAMIE